MLIDKGKNPNFTTSCQITPTLTKTFQSSSPFPLRQLFFFFPSVIEHFIAQIHLLSLLTFFQISFLYIFGQFKNNNSKKKAERAVVKQTRILQSSEGWGKTLYSEVNSVPFRFFYSILDSIPQCFWTSRFFFPCYYNNFLHLFLSGYFCHFSGIWKRKNKHVIAILKGKHHFWYTIFNIQENFLGSIMLLYFLGFRSRVTLTFENCRSLFLYHL